MEPQDRGRSLREAVEWAGGRRLMTALQAYTFLREQKDKVKPAVPNRQVNRENFK